MQQSQSIIEFLEAQCTHPIQDPLWGQILLPKQFIDVIRSPQFITLSDIKQLGPSYLVYPGATHTRANHSIGVFAIAKLFVIRILSRGSNLTQEGVLAFLLAALTHDLGHFPFTHSLKELPLKDHEELTGEILLEHFTAHPINSYVDVKKAALIVNTRAPSSDPEVLFYRKILSGVLDPDKLDYLRRDAYFCGLPFGEQDLDFVLEHAQAHPDFGIVLTEPGVKSVEHILFSKYLMYRSVYWNSSVRIATGMVKKSLFAAIAKDQILKPEELYFLTDHAFFDLLGRKNHPSLSSALMVPQSKLFTEILSIPIHEFASIEPILMDLNQRFALELELGRHLFPHESNSQNLVLIDVPERISFESHMKIIGKDGAIINYHESNTVFTPEVVKAFTNTLRIVRIAIHPDFSSKIDSQNLRAHFLTLAGSL